ncbi:hypothetical protein GCM10012280_63120 [Wenjunlia tyrosinilytica]|uniref:Uncharacterized protein n=1 Tax=Wenjunlia tyrosinilytica TaxID=1544741 RepID=A0A917ZYE2_9ACTN|nr:hypothetical protein GCM10012280_63120 [Wenjunlia tyrosinilytica]
MQAPPEKNYVIPAPSAPGAPTAAQHVKAPDRSDDRVAATADAWYVLGQVRVPCIMSRPFLQVVGRHPRRATSRGSSLSVSIFAGATLLPSRHTQVYGLATGRTLRKQP